MTQKVRIQETGRFDLEAALGLVRRNGGNLEPGHKFGFNPAVGTTAEGVHTLGGPILFPTSAQTVRIKVGGDAEDTAAGDGARSVKVLGIDDNLDEIEETIVTAGALASTPTVAKFWRVYRAFVEDVGTYGVSNTADIVIENTTSLQELIGIPAGDGQSQTSLVSTPQKRPLIITYLTLDVESTKIVDFKLFVREGFNRVVAPFCAKRIRLVPTKTPEGIWPTLLDTPILVPELSDVWLEASVAATAAQAGTIMSYYNVPTR